MNTGRTIFSQLLDYAPRYELDKCVRKYANNSKARTFSFWDQYIAMLFAQLTYRESLRDIEACLHAVKQKVYHAGLRSRVTRSTLAYANDSRDWRIWQDFTSVLIENARTVLTENQIEHLDLPNTVYALDATVIDLCLTLFPWAQFRSTKAAVKMHTLLDLRCNIPSFIDITEGKTHEVNILDSLPIEVGAFYIMDRGYLDFARLYRLTQSLAFFVTRAKSNTRMRRLYSRPIDKGSNVRSDHIIVLSGIYTGSDYPTQLRRVTFYDEQNDQILVFLTNNFDLSAETVAMLYKARWKIELFFKWIKQHLRIKVFFGTSENAVKTQIWIAVSSYVLVALLRHHQSLPQSQYEVLQVLSIALFEKTTISEAFSRSITDQEPTTNGNQLILF